MDEIKKMIDEHVQAVRRITCRDLQFNVNRKLDDFLESTESEDVKVVCYAIRALIDDYIEENLK